MPAARRGRRRVQEAVRQHGQGVGLGARLHRLRVRRADVVDDRRDGDPHDDEERDGGGVLGLVDGELYSGGVNR